MNVYNHCPLNLTILSKVITYQLSLISSGGKWAVPGRHEPVKSGPARAQHEPARALAPKRAGPGRASTGFPRPSTSTSPWLLGLPCRRASVREKDARLTALGGYPLFRRAPAYCNIYPFFNYLIKYTTYYTKYKF